MSDPAAAPAAPAAAPAAIDSVTDSTGRVLSLQILDPADMLDLLEAAGTASSNGGWVRYAMVVCSVSAIDGVPAPRPRDKDQVKKRARALGNAGFSAVSKALFGDPNAELEDGEEPDAGALASQVNPSADQVKN